MNQHFPPPKAAPRSASAKKGRAQKPAAPPQEPKLDGSQDTVAKTIEVIERYFDAEGRPIKHKTLGAARIARRYDRRGNQIEEAYYNSCGKPTERRDLGAAYIAWRYDENGRRLSADFFSANGALIAHEDAEALRRPRSSGGSRRINSGPRLFSRASPKGVAFHVPRGRDAAPHATCSWA